MLKIPFMISERIGFFVFNDIKMKVWKFENKSRAYFRRGLFSESFSCSDLGGLFSGGLFSGGLIFGIIRYFFIISTVTDSIFQVAMQKVAKFVSEFTP